jgi:hypothetical protein
MLPACGDRPAARTGARTISKGPATVNASLLIPLNARNKSGESGSVGRQVPRPRPVSVKFSGDTLLGNFSFAASEINASDPITGAFVGTIPIDDGAGHTPGGLWSPSGPGAPPEEAPTREAEEDWDGDGGGCCSKVACHGWRCGVEAGSFADAVAVRQKHRRPDRDPVCGQVTHGTKRRQSMSARMSAIEE